MYEELADGCDCSLLRPTMTTSTLEPGCCRSFSYKAQAKGVTLMDQIGCERMVTEGFSD